MTELLEKTFAEVSKLPRSEQEALAAWILEVLASERRWQQTFNRSEDDLSRLADEALDEYRRNQTRELDPNQL